MKKTHSAFVVVFILIFGSALQCQELANYKSLGDFHSLSKSKLTLQKPTKKVYFTPGGKIGMFFPVGDYSGEQLIALEVFGHYRAEKFFAEIGIPFRFKTSPAFTDIGIDINVFYPFLGPENKSELDPFVGGGLGLHFVGRDRNDSTGKTSIAARGGLGLNLVIGLLIFKNYDFNIVAEVKYFNYLREFDERRYHGFGINVGATLPR
jgi:hypothetical protein